MNQVFAFAIAKEDHSEASIIDGGYDSQQQVWVTKSGEYWAEPTSCRTAKCGSGGGAGGPSCADYICDSSGA